MVNWADRYAGPSIGEAEEWGEPALCTGLDNLETMVVDSPDDCARQVADTTDQANSRPIMITASCTHNLHRVPMMNLHAIRREVKIVVDTKLA